MTLTEIAEVLDNCAHNKCENCRHNFIMPIEVCQDMLIKDMAKETRKCNIMLLNKKFGIKGE